jgi:hypothetical protein
VSETAIPDASDWPRPGDDDHASAFEGTLADGLEDEPAATAPPLRGGEQGC